jgi:hypothetical protein
MAETKPFIATERIWVGGFLAHEVGDEVPAANVELNGWEDKVARPGTKAAATASDGT